MELGMKKPLLGEKIAVLVANGFSEKDLTFTQKNLVNAGGVLRIVGMDHGLVNSWNDQGWGLNFATDQVLSEALAADFDMLIVPGGQRSIDKLKLTAHTRRFVGGFVGMNKPVAFFEEAVDLLLFAERAQGYTVTGPEKLQAEAEMAGADWSGESSVVCKNIITGRSSDHGNEAYALEVGRFLVEASVACKAQIQQAA
jgi:protease I